MKISVVQPDIIWEEKSENLRKLDLLIAALYGKTDLVVLPELFSTGFSMNPGRLSELPGSETFRWMESTAGRGNFGLCGSYMVNDNNLFRNRFVFVSQDGRSWHYDKRHLFSMADENRAFSPGEERLIFSFGGTRITLFICYDLRFPVWSRNRNDYDLAIYSANWPAGRREGWNTLLKARAIENQCYVAGSNRIGTDGNGVSYCGDSMIVDPYGKVMAGTNLIEEGSITCEISMTELSDFRKKFPVLEDADEFSIKI